MSKPDCAVLLYGDVSVNAVTAALPPWFGHGGIDVHRMPANKHAWSSQGEPVVLLGIGREGCEAVARRVSEGLDGVVAICLIGPEAPWAESVRHCDQCSLTLAACCCDGSKRLSSTLRLPLGPLEPLRAVADRARMSWTCGDMVGKDGNPVAPTARDCDRPATRWSYVYDTATIAVCDTNHDDCEPWDGWGHAEGTSAIRVCKVIITCHPEPAVCAECGGLGDHRLISKPSECPACAGTGKALGSREVAAELCGEMAGPYSANPATFVTGGIRGLLYPTRAAFDSHAIADALRLAID